MPKAKARTDRYDLRGVADKMTIYQTPIEFEIFTGEIASLAINQPTSSRWQVLHGPAAILFPAARPVPYW
jgi:hypothetical protein